jgi:hypothetical protein
VALLVYKGGPWKKSSNILVFDIDNNPETPAGPVEPVAPVFAADPGGPVNPVGPIGPVAPVFEADPGAPVGAIGATEKVISSLTSS